ncbi:MAG: cobyric acid synthase CobQ [Magnetovibrio sp.]|nr:cobyric acid synthase CobQ [Magnetovibrio sp.]
MIQGTGSDVGKSLLVAGLCRLLQKRGKKIAPFKPQNMSNNAAVTLDGGEIGRAQALQARACAIAPSVHMNPILLKPQTDIGAQVIVQGHVSGNAKARDFHALKPKLLAAVLESFEIVGSNRDIVIVEGAGSPAEINLRAGDIANMEFAEAVDIPVIIVADIDRGGVIASLIGTHAVLTELERKRVGGFIINKFRGDISLFNGGVQTIRDSTGWPCLGIVPYFSHANRLPAEDAMSLDEFITVNQNDKSDIKFAVPRLSRIANFDDLDPLIQEPGIVVEVVEAGRPLPNDADAILLPGSKSTLTDLKYLRIQGWDIDILAHHRQGGVVVGLCGGYQMLGNTVADLDGIEGPAGTVQGLGILDVETVISRKKTLEEVKGSDNICGSRVRGYEMHMGKTTGKDTERPWITLEGGRPEGAQSSDGRVMGTYLHGLFTEDSFRHAFLNLLSSNHARCLAYEQQVENTLDELSEHIERYVDIESILDLSV